MGATEEIIALGTETVRYWMFIGVLGILIALFLFGVILFFRSQRYEVRLR